ncbi:MAG TPA: 2-amino-4-hydroxy-6-hydroxymethyldihydropteridine diphosphokinase [Steroidobacteraceae bacterium]|jgi:2-amino-4-hydroxy-6-hydroxymethyldihydropteridine diphosphokinase|nr:2-amino-4-hydroxy-6-hydroxymethyldihydropteridine diphosphokinase [Steroidobacteraceae bacterium]
MAVWQPAYIGLGSNLSDPAQQVRQALHELAGLPQTRSVAVSRLYGSRPMGPVTQPDFVNAVAGVVTQLPALELLRHLQRLEGAAGRPAVHEHWGPRVIDLDLLVFGCEQCTSAELVLPHPGVVARNFVLYPLADIAPDLNVPGHGRVRELLPRVSADGVWLL